jgi:acetyl-CoA carboxylase carboxyl transferase subunit alpha
VAVIGHQKGRDTRQRIRRNFGQPRPEGYRKALRIMRSPSGSGCPVLTFVDTRRRLSRDRRRGARPGRGDRPQPARDGGAAGAHRRHGQRRGGSGGALALGVADRVFVLEYSTYSVISPEGCAAILWKDQSRKAEAAEAMRLTAPDLAELGVVDDVIPEPMGGAHTDPAAAARAVGARLEAALVEIEELSIEEMLDRRYEKFRAMGAYVERD